MDAKLMPEEVAIGYVYILENDSMPGLIKIGKTSRDSDDRAKELWTTGVPTPFKVAFELSSAQYEKLESEMHNKLAGHRVTSNREFFKYPVNRAISLLKKLDTEKQDGINPRIIDRKKKLGTRVSDFFRRLFRPKLDEPNKTQSGDRESTEIGTNGVYLEPTFPVTSPESSVDYVMKDGPLQNEYGENTVELSLNGKPYYSEKNGFYWAANHQGIPECVPQHIKRIIHNEELEVASTRDELEQEINYLHEKAVELEEQKRECEQEIAQQTQELAGKKEEMAGLEVQLKALTVTRSEPVPTEDMPDNSDPELFNGPVAERPSDNPIIKPFAEEINDLIQEKTELESAIDTKSQALARKKEEFAKLEVELRGPTETELNPITRETASRDARSVKHGFSWLGFVTAFISTVFFVCLATYLFIFYASAVDKAFFLNTDAIRDQLTQGTYAGVNDVVNPKALFKAFQGEWNLFVLMFPFVFLAFAIALDYFWEQGKWGYLVASLLAGLTLVFDGILAIQISQKIHEAKVIMGQETGQWAFRITDLNMWTVVFCGFIVSILVSIVYHVMNQRWKAVWPPQENPKASDLREVKINSEKTQREANIAVLKTEMDNLQSEIDRLKAKDNAIQEKIVSVVKAPIETQSVVLKVEIDNLQSEIDQLKKKHTDIQEKIKDVNANIEKLSSQRNKRVVNRNKMESQVNQFLNGWCRFVVHSHGEVSDVSRQIEEIKQAAKETLDRYYQGAPDYSGQP